MKKLISLVMAGAMVLSLVPATAFAKGEVTATAKVVDALKKTKGFDDVASEDNVPELQLKVTGVDYLTEYTASPELDVTVSLDNAEFFDVLDAIDNAADTNADSVSDLTTGAGSELEALADELADRVHFEPDDAPTVTHVIVVDEDSITKDEFKFTIKGTTGTGDPEDFRLAKDDLIAIELSTILTKSTNGTKATVSVDSKAVTADDLAFCTILDTGISASVKKTVDIAEDEVATLDSHGITVKTAVGNFTSGQKFTLKLSNGFEFSEVPDGDDFDVNDIDDNEATITYNAATADDEFTIDDVEIEATSAKSGAVATLTVKAVAVSAINTTFSATTTVEVAKVVDYKVNLTIDEDEDVPVIYSGVNVENDGLTDDSDHMSLEVTAEETFPGAWSMRQGFTFDLPEGVYVTNVDVTDADNFYQDGSQVADQELAWDTAFFNAYQEGEHEKFDFEKRVFDDVNTDLDDDAATVTFKLELVADPDFEGDVVLTMEGALLDTQSVTIAKFVKPYTVKAEQNDVIIDYRNTAIETPITITEAEEGLLEENTIFVLNIEDNLIDFDGDPKVAVDDASDLTIKDDDTDDGTFVFAIDDESDSAATITISAMELFMNRSIPAGGYDLEIDTTMSDNYDVQVLFAPDELDVYDETTYAASITSIAGEWDADDARPATGDVKKDSYIDDVCDYSNVVKEAFINVVTSGRDQDNLFTTKVVVPVGEAYLVAGETKVTLDAPAYISAAGYTMLPVRAVSSALGVDTNNVLWSAETKTVTIMFAQRIISMTVGQKTIYVNGSAIPASAAPEIKDGRTFLPLRDLGTALGVTNVAWDSATKTATLN